jgi:hypothetical protein
MSNRLDKKTEELEQTLAMQLEMLKKESEDWLKVGAVVAVGVLLTYGVVKATRKRKIKPTDRAIDILDKEGLLNDDIKRRLTKSNKSSFWPSMTQRLLVLGFALAKDRLFNEIFSPRTDVVKVEEGK